MADEYVSVAHRMHWWMVWTWSNVYHNQYCGSGLSGWWYYNNESVKSQLQWKESNRQNYKYCVVYLKTSNLRNLVYHCNVCASRKQFLKFMLSNKPSTNFYVMPQDRINYEVYWLYVFVLLFASTFTKYIQRLYWVKSMTYRYWLFSNSVYTVGPM